MEKIQMTTPLVEMDGDEMTRVLWQQIKDELLLPYIDLKTEYYDLGLPERERTKDQVTVDSAEATKKYGVAVKCATITPNAQRVEEYRLSPDVEVSQRHHPRHPGRHRVPRPHHGQGHLSRWSRPGSIPSPSRATPTATFIRCTEYRVPGPGRAELVFTGEDGKEEFRQTVYDFECPGVLQGQYNKDSSIASFARSCFQYAIDTKTGPVVRHQGHHLQAVRPHLQGHLPGQVFDAEYKADLRRRWASTYFYTLIDDAVARVDPLRGRLHLGLQELRRRRDERHGFHRLRLPGHDDLCAGEPRTANMSMRPPTAPSPATTTST